MVASKLQSNWSHKPSYADVRECLGERDLRTIAHNTYITTAIDHEQKPCLVLALHGNHIVRWYETGEIFISAGGWSSVTTKSRLNQFTNGRVFQKNHVWYYTDHEENEKEFQFRDESRMYGWRGAVAWNRIA